MNLRAKDVPRYAVTEYLLIPLPKKFCVFDRLRSDNIAYCDEKEDAATIVEALNYLHHGAGMVSVPGTKTPLTMSVEIVSPVDRCNGKQGGKTLEDGTECPGCRRACL